MPAETLRSEIGKHRKSIGWGELFELKRIFGVSVQALTYRCKDLGIFGAPVVRQLFNEFRRRGWRSPPHEEPGAMPGERPMRFERLCSVPCRRERSPRPRPPNCSATRYTSSTDAWMNRRASRRNLPEPEQREGPGFRHLRPD